LINTEKNRAEGNGYTGFIVRSRMQKSFEMPLIIVVLFVSGYALTKNDLIGSWNSGYADTMRYCMYKKSGSVILNEICRDSIVSQQSQAIARYSFRDGDSVTVVATQTGRSFNCVYTIRNDTLCITYNDQLFNVFIQKNDNLSAIEKSSLCSFSSNPPDTENCLSLQKVLVLKKESTISRQLSTRAKQKVQCQASGVFFTANGREISSKAAIIYRKDSKNGKILLPYYKK
jgi:hypothetical protein